MLTLLLAYAVTVPFLMVAYINAPWIGIILDFMCVQACAPSFIASKSWCAARSNDPVALLRGVLEQSPVCMLESACIQALVELTQGPVLS